MTRALWFLPLVLAVSGCSSDDDGSNATSQDGGSGGTSGAGGSAGNAGTGGSPTENPADYVDKPLREQVAALEAGKITSTGLTELYLERIATRDSGPDGIHAVMLLDPKAVERAGVLDTQAGGKKLLQGAPILVKDNIDTQGLATTAGSKALADNVPTADAHVVARLHQANGLMLGKTNLSEWANFRSYSASSGWSSQGGQTKNGDNPDYNPCGSSSGSAAAVAAGLAPAALGTETDGSIVCPASVNGVVGFKPTVGLVSRAGVIPISHSQDTVGPIARTVGDAARVLSAIAGPDPNDPATQAIPATLSLDFEAPLDAATLQGKRLGVVTLGVDPAVSDLFDQQRGRLEAAGATLVDVPLNKNFGQNELTVLLYEFKVGLNAYLASHPRPGQPSTLAELIAFNETNAATVMPYFGQEIFVQAEATTGLSSPEYLTAKQTAQDAAGKNGIDAVLAANGLDALIAPTGDVAWMTDYANGDAPGAFISGPAAVAGYPHVTVPMGRVSGLPAGLSIFAGAWDDAKVLALAHAYEKLPP